MSGCHDSEKGSTVRMVATDRPPSDVEVLKIQIDTLQEKLSEVWETIDMMRKVADHQAQQLQDYEDRLDEIEDGDY